MKLAHFKTFWSIFEIISRKKCWSFKSEKFGQHWLGGEPILIFFSDFNSIRETYAYHAGRHPVKLKCEKVQKIKNSRKREKYYSNIVWVWNDNPFQVNLLSRFRRPFECSIWFLYRFCTSLSIWKSYMNSG